MPMRVVRGVDVQEIDATGGTLRVRADSPSGSLEVGARLVIAADGAHSTIRRRYLPGVPARSYPDCYIMGDFPDDTGHGSDAVLYLEPEGIVESFPLPGGVRRWVVRLGAPHRNPTPVGLARADHSQDR